MIRGFDVLHNFISPVTGRVLATENYVLVGNVLGIAVPAPDLIDLRLDLINLRGDFDIASSASYIIGVPNAKLPNAQVLNSLLNGFIFNTAGVVSTSAIIPIESLPDLAENNIWIGNATNRPIASSNFVQGPSIPTIPFNVAVWSGVTGRDILDGGVNVIELQALASTAELAADLAVAAAEEALVAAGVSTAAAALALFGGGKGKRGDAGSTGGAGSAGLAGIPGAAGASGRKTIVIDSNISILGSRIQDIAPSPQADYDAVSAKWVWDLLNDNVEIKWE